MRRAGFQLLGDHSGHMRRGETRAVESVSQSAAAPSQSSLAIVSSVPGATTSGFIRPSSCIGPALKMLTFLKSASVRPTEIPLYETAGTANRVGLPGQWIVRIAGVENRDVADASAELMPRRIRRPIEHHVQRTVAATERGDVVERQIEHLGAAIDGEADAVADLHVVAKSDVAVEYPALT